jgi:hypothetical protein
MFKSTILIALFLMFFFPVQVNTQGSEKYTGEEKTEEKITPLKDEVQGNDLEEITKKEINIVAIESEVTKSTVPTVIKAISLAIAVFSLAYAYFPKKRKENSNV